MGMNPMNRGVGTCYGQAFREGTLVALPDRFCLGMCKFRNARSDFRNLHVDPLSLHTSTRNKQVEFNPYIYTLKPGHTARTLLERSLSGAEKGQNFGNAHHRAQNGKQWQTMAKWQNRKHGRCLSGAPLRPALL